MCHELYKRVVNKEEVFRVPKGYKVSKCPKCGHIIYTACFSLNGYLTLQEVWGWYKEPIAIDIYSFADLVLKGAVERWNEGY